MDLGLAPSDSGFQNQTSACPRHIQPLSHRMRVQQGPPPPAARTYPPVVTKNVGKHNHLRRARWLLQDWGRPEGTSNSKSSCLMPASAQQAQFALHAALGHLRKLGSQRGKRALVGKSVFEVENQNS